MEIQTVGARRKLPIGGDIHWHKTTTGAYIGFRRTGETTGTWWARWFVSATRKQLYQRLGDYPGVIAAKQFDAAAKDAARWFRECDMGVTHDTSIQTVADACRAYVETARVAGNTRKADDADKRFKRYVYSDPIGKVKLTALRPAQVKTWRERMIAEPALVSRNADVRKTRPRSSSTVNRDMASIRAALNAALEDGVLESDIAWRKHLKAIPNADKRRDIYLTVDERRALLAAADPEIQPFLRGLMLLPFRPGALAGLVVGDLDKRSKMLRVGVDKHGQDRRIGLPDRTAQFLAEQTKGKLPAAPLFAQANGSAWNKDAWKGPIKDGVTAAKIRPDATAYALRHSAITDLCAKSGNSLLVAQISGTSVQMIEKHYGHLLNEHAAEALAGLQL